MGPRARVDGCGENILSPPWLEPQTVQTVPTALYPPPAPRVKITVGTFKKNKPTHKDIYRHKHKHWALKDFTLISELLCS